MSTRPISTNPITLPLVKNDAIVQEISRNGFSDGVLDLTFIALTKLQEFRKMKFDTSSDQAILETYEKLLCEKELCLVFKAGKDHYYKNTLIGKLAALFNRFFGSSPIVKIDHVIWNLDRKINELRPRLEPFTEQQKEELSKLAATNAYTKLPCTQRLHPEAKSIQEILAMNVPIVPSKAAPKLDPARVSVTPTEALLSGQQPKRDSYLESDEYNFHLELAKQKMLEAEKKKLEEQKKEQEAVKQHELKRAALKVFKENKEKLNHLLIKAKILEKTNRLDSKIPLGEKRDAIFASGSKLIEYCNQVSKIPSNEECESEIHYIDSEIKRIENLVRELKNPTQSEAIRIPTPDGSPSITPTSRSPVPEVQGKVTDENDLNEVLEEWDEFLSQIQE